MKKLMLVAALVVAFVIPGSVRADWEWSPFGIGLAAPVQLPYTTTDIYGLRLTGFYGMNNDVYGVSWGLANAAGGDTLALEVGGVNAAFDTAAGVQLAVVNYANSFMGLQIGGINWVNADTYGVQLGFFNCDQGPVVGFDVGAINYASRFDGLQVGFLNFAYEANGLQIGAINACDTIHGVQIGFINLVCDGPLPIMVIANASF